MMLDFEERIAWLERKVNTHDQALSVLKAKVKLRLEDDKDTVELDEFGRYNPGPEEIDRQKKLIRGAKGEL